MKILCSIARRNAYGVALAVCDRPSADGRSVGLGRIHGVVDESSSSTYEFTGQSAFIRSSVAKGSTLLRYNVVPVGDILKPITDPCCEKRSQRTHFGLN